MTAMWTDVASAATALGVLAAVVQLVLSRRQARSTFEQEFVKRYWVITDDALQQADHDSHVKEQRYLRLCEDEFEVMRLGSASWRTWEVWHEAIRDEAGKYPDRVDTHEWLSTCLGAEHNHQGSDCPGIFKSGSGIYSGHLSARWRSSLSRRCFVWMSALRRRIYDGGQS
jgi:hypothetical protein